MSEKNRTLKKIREKNGKRVRKAVSAALPVYLMMSQPVYASVAGVTDNINALKGLIISVVSGVGVIILVYNIWNWAQAYQSHDNASMGQAIKGVIGGLTMAAVGAVLAFLGF